MSCKIGRAKGCLVLLTAHHDRVVQECCCISSLQILYETAHATRPGVGRALLHTMRTALLDASLASSPEVGQQTGAQQAGVQHKPHNPSALGASASAVWQLVMTLASLPLLRLQVRHAVATRQAVMTSNYTAFFRLYAEAPHLGRALMDLVAPTVSSAQRGGQAMQHVAMQAGMCVVLAFASTACQSHVLLLLCNAAAPMGCSERDGQGVQDAAASQLPGPSNGLHACQVAQPSSSSSTAHDTACRLPLCSVQGARSSRADGRGGLQRVCGVAESAWSCVRGGRTRCVHNQDRETQHACGDSDTQ